MSNFYCKQCGGELPYIRGKNIVTCEYCGYEQSIPDTDSPDFLKRFSEANDLWQRRQFDSAAAVYSTLAVDYPNEAEVYWRSILCKYGIEYVNDAKTGKKVPTCHRASNTLLTTDPVYEKVMKCASEDTKELYRKEAEFIDNILKEYHKEIAKEEPYDVFICFKDKQDNGERTIDSVLAQDIYDALTEPGQGYKVFFSRITLKLGTLWEPKIFAALNTAKVMLVVGCTPENFNSDWVRNEWSRYLEIVARDSAAGKKLIPCYRNMDPYDMPKEFKNLQGVNMALPGSMQDLVKSVNMVIPPRKDPDSQGKPEPGSLEAFIEKGNENLNTGYFERAKYAYKKALEKQEDNLEALVGLRLAGNKIKTRKEHLKLVDNETIAPDEAALQKIMAAAEKENDIELKAWYYLCMRVRDMQMIAARKQKRAMEAEQREKEKQAREKERQNFAKSKKVAALAEEIRKEMRIEIKKDQFFAYCVSQDKLKYERHNCVVNRKKMKSYYGQAAALTIAGLAYILLLIIKPAWLSGFFHKLGWFNPVLAGGFLLAGVLLFVRTVKNKERRIELGNRIGELDEEIQALEGKLSETAAASQSLETNMIMNAAAKLKKAYIDQYGDVDPNASGFNYLKIARALFDEISRERMKGRVWFDSVGWKE